MDKQTFYQYCQRLSSSEEKTRVFDKYYDPEATFEHPVKGTFKGKDALVNFWTSGHRGIHEVLEPTNVVIGGDRIAAEFKIEWHCLEDTDYLGPRKKGEVYYAACAAFYLLKNNRFVHVKLYLSDWLSP